MALPKVSVTEDVLILVEGQDEERLLAGLIQHLGVEGVQVIATGGRDQFGHMLEAVLGDARTKDITVKTIGVIRDADDDASVALQSVRDALILQGVDARHNHGELSPGTPNVGVFIAPDGVINGAIETLVWESVRFTDVGQCVAQYMDCVRAAGRLDAHDEGKALIHAYLSTRSDPTATVGRGADHHYWTFDHEAFRELTKFVQTLATA